MVHLRASMRACFPVFIFSGLLLASLATLPDGAVAQTMRAKTESGKKVVLEVIAQYSLANCASLVSNPRLDKPTANGKLTVRMAKAPATGGSCNGRQVNVLVVEYVSNRGFKGKDVGIVSYRGPGTRRMYTEGMATGTQKRTYRITVD